MRPRVVRVKANRLPVVGHGLVEFALTVEDEPQVDVRLNVIGVNANHVAELCNGLVEFPLTAKCDP